MFPSDSALPLLEPAEGLAVAELKVFVLDSPSSRTSGASLEYEV